MAKQARDNNLNAVYVLIISLILIGSLGLVATLLVRRIWFGNSERIIDASFRSIEREGEVQGARDSTLGEAEDVPTDTPPVTAGIQAKQPEKIILQITNPTEEPVFFKPAEALTVYNAAGEAIEFRTNETVTVILSREAKNIDVYGNFDTATRLELTLPELETTLPL